MDSEKLLACTDKKPANLKELNAAGCKKTKLHQAFHYNAHHSFGSGIPAPVPDPNPKPDPDHI